MKGYRFRASNLLGAFLLVGIDQGIKHAVRDSDMDWICNPGIAFGIRIPLGFFYLVWIIITVGLLLWSRKDGRISLVAVTCVLAGGVSNVIDRLAFGCVVDFIDLAIWPVFNLSDVLIVGGSAFIAIRIFRNPVHKQHPDLIA